MDEVDRAARNYLISLISTLKKTRAAREKQEQEVRRWEQRVALAREKGREDLAAQAEERAGEAKQALGKLQSEEQEVLGEFREAQARYKIESMVPKKRIDPEQLLAALESVSGPPDTLQDELNRTAVDEQLTALKGELQGEQRSGDLEKLQSGADKPDNEETT
ncbi:MAG: hypothetical protein R6V86_04100 [Spirochaetia bacterium]